MRRIFQKLKHPYKHPYGIAPCVPPRLKRAQPTQIGSHDTGIPRIRYAVPHNIGRRFDRDVVVEAGHARRRKKKPSRAYRAEPETIYRNIFLVRLAHDGRCSEFTECFMKEPAAED